MGGRRRRSARSGGLTPRQLEVLAFVARGMGNAEVGEAMGLRTETVKRHLSNAYEVLGVRSRGEGVAAALASGALSAEALWSAGGDRWRCPEGWCGCEIAVVVTPPEGSNWRPPVCHGREMVRVAGPSAAS
jgi:DNA-binding CsgD family transcriptional regulator